MTIETLIAELTERVPKNTIVAVTSHDGNGYHEINSINIRYVDRESHTMRLLPCKNLNNPEDGHAFVILHLDYAGGAG